MELVIQVVYSWDSHVYQGRLLHDCGVRGKIEFLNSE